MPSASFLGSPSCDRNGRLVPSGPSGPGDSSKVAAHGGFEERRWEGDQRRDCLLQCSSTGCRPPASGLAQRRDRDQHHHRQQEQPEDLHQKQQRDGERSGSADAQRPAHGTAAATNRLHKMFEEALDGLLQKENMVPPAADSTSSAVKGSDRDRIPNCNGIGWVEVVRQVVSAVAVSFGVPGQSTMLHEKVLSSYGTFI